MKKKYVASFLSICMILTTIGPTALASETADLSAVSDSSVLEEIQYETEEVEDENEEEILEEEIIANDGADDNLISEDEYVIDNEENADDSSEVSTYASDDTAFVINDDENLKEGYTRLEKQSNIQFKYDEEHTTLYFDLIDPKGASNMPSADKASGGYPTSQWGKADISDSVTKIIIGEGISSIGEYNFYTNGTGCFGKVVYVYLPNSVKKIEKGAFQVENTTVSQKEIDLSHVQEIGESAFSDSNISEVNLSNATTIGESAFYKCNLIRNVTMNKENVTIGASAFAYCGYLTTVTSKTIDSIGDSAFQSTDALEKIELKGIKSIGSGVFAQSGLQELSISFNEEEIGNINARALFGSAKLKNICYTGTTEQWKNKNFNKKVTCHCKNDPEPKPATCTEDGVKILTCEICGGKYTDNTVVPALNHEYSEEYTVDKAATCTETGSESKHCIRCGEIEDGSEKEIPVLGHDYVAEITTQPTCTKDGVRTLTCSRCKDVKTETIPATGVHQWSDWKKTADATVFTAEQQERNCATCDKKETRTVGDKLAATATVSASSVTLKEKQSTGTVKVTGLANGDSITSWKSTNTKVFTVSGKADGTCKLTGVKKGDAKLEITLASGLKKTVSVKVQAKTVTTSKISGLAKKMTVKKGEKATLKPVIKPATSQQKVTYSSSNKSVATVSSKGVVTAKKAGTAKITVKSGSKKVTVTVTVPKTKTKAIKVGEKVSVKKGKAYSLKAKTTPSNSDEKITYKTSNKKIATVSKSGKIKGVKKGTATITIKSGKIVKKVKVTVK